MLHVGAAFRTQINDDVKDGATRASNELGLGRRGILEVHTTDRTFFSVICHVGLGNNRFEAVRPEQFLAEGASKVATGILLSIQIDDEGAPKLGLSKNHSSPRMSR